GQSGMATGTTAWSIPSVTLGTKATVITLTAVDVTGKTTSTTLTVQRPVAVVKPTVKIYTPTTATSYITAETGVVVAGIATGAITQVTWTNSAGGSGKAFTTTTATDTTSATWSTSRI